MKRAPFAAAALLAGTSCLLPAYEMSGGSGAAGCEEVVIPPTPFAKSLGGPSWAEIRGLDADPCGNTYVVGNFDGEVAFGPTLRLEGDNSESFVAEVKPNGDYGWMHKIGGAEIQQSCCVTLLPDGLAVVGDYSLELTFDDEMLLAGGDSMFRNGFVIRQSADGSFAGHSILDRGGMGDVQVRAVDGDATGRIAVGGYFTGGLNIAEVSYTSDGSENGFVIVLDGANLSVLLDEHFEGPGVDRVTSVAFDEDGALYVAGVIDGNQFWKLYRAGEETMHELDVGGGGEQAFVAPLSASDDLVLVLRGGQQFDDGTNEYPISNNFAAARFTPQGNVQWHVEFPDQDPITPDMGVVSEVWGIHHDAAAGYVHIAGGVRGGPAFIVKGGMRIGALEPDEFDFNDVMLVSFQVSDGSPHHRLFGEPGEQHAHAVFGAGEHLLLAGDYGGTLVFDSLPALNPEGDDAFLVRMLRPTP